jgi:hypothetical protein
MRALDASPWLALSMAILVAISALLHDGHAPASAAEDTALQSKTPTPSLQPNGITLQAP